MAASGASKADARILAGPIWREVLRFGAPIAIGMGLQTTFNLVDSYIVARLPEEVAAPALGALGICDQISAVGTIVSYGVTTASTAMISIAHGKGDKDRVRALVWQSMLAVGVLGVVFGVGTSVLAHPILAGVVGAKGAVAELGTRYLRVNAGAGFAMFFLLQMTAIERALGSAKTPVALLVLSNVINLFLAVLLVYGDGPAPPVFAWGAPIAGALGIPRLGLVGAAWATLLARFITLVPVGYFLARRFDVLSWASVRAPDRPLLTQMVRVAWPSSTQLVVRILAMLVTQTLVARAFTTAEDQSATTAIGVVFRLETAALFVAMGWGSAAQTFVGQNLGARQERRARAAGTWAAAYDAVFMVALGVAFRAYAEPIVRFFVADPHVVAMAAEYVATIAWSYIGLGTCVVLGSAITGSGATRTTLLTDLVNVVGMQVPLCVAAVLLPGATLGRLWLAIAVSYFASAFLCGAVYRFASWTRAAAVAEGAPLAT